MSRAERVVIGLLMGGFSALLCFVAFWWAAAALFARGLPGVGEAVVRNTALAGLAAGILLDILFLKRWIDAFYSLPLPLAIAVYLVLCMIAVAVFMALPVGTFGAGLLAGAYVGRRARFLGQEGPRLARTANRTALLSAAVTTGSFLPFGLMGRQEPAVAGVARSLGVRPDVVAGSGGAVLVVALSLILFSLQRLCTKRAAAAAFGHR